MKLTHKTCARHQRVSVYADMLGLLKLFYAASPVNPYVLGF